VPYRGRCVNLVIATKKRYDIVPCVSRRGEAVQEHNGRTVRRRAAKSYISPPGRASFWSAFRNGLRSSRFSTFPAADNGSGVSRNSTERGLASPRCAYRVSENIAEV
jgi:hypothetical protein